MKLILFILMSCFSTAHAQKGVSDGGGSVLRVVFVADHFPIQSSQKSRLTKIEILEKGIVHRRTISLGNHHSEIKDVVRLNKELMSQVVRCSEQLSKLDFNPHSSPCTDSIVVSYKSGDSKKEFAIQECGSLQSIQSKCAKDMVKLLDMLYNIEPISVDKDFEMK